MPTKTSISIEIGNVVRRLTPKAPRAAKAIADQIWAEIPSYAGLDSAAREEIEAAAERNFVSFLTGLSEGKDLPARDIDALAKVGEERAHQGLPIEDVLRAFRTVGRVLWDQIAEELNGPKAPRGEVAVELSRRLMSFTDEISSAVAHHYSEAQRAIVRRQEASRREFLHDLLMGTYDSPNEMIGKAQAFGYDLARPQTALVVSGDAGDGNSQQLALARALDRISERLGVAGHPMVDRRGGRTIGVFAGSAGVVQTPQEIGSAVLEELGPGNWQVGVGGAYASLEGCRRSYVEASEALEIGSVIDPGARVYPFESFLLYRFLRADPALAERFVEAVLGEVLEHDRRRRSELVKTLSAWFEADGSAKAAGESLFAHPHTVTYRLKQIERLTGRSLRSPEDKLHLNLAVKAHKLSTRIDSTNGDRSGDSSRMC